MEKKQIEKLIYVNQRLSLLLGYAMSVIDEHVKCLPDNQREKCEWLSHEVDNLLYFDNSDR